MKLRLLRLMLAFTAATAILSPGGVASAVQPLNNVVPEAIQRLKLAPIGRLAATNSLAVALGFQVRDPAGLSNLLAEIYRPGSPNYRHYLTTRQFADRFGASAEDFQAAIDFAKANHLEVVRAHDNRLLLDLKGNVADVEKAFRVTMLRYQHPTEGREFFSPSAEPALATNLHLLQIDGLNDYALPVSTWTGAPRSPAARSYAKPKDGSGTAGDFAGKDYRTAYAPGVPEGGTGQMVGLVEFAGYYQSDIDSYTQGFGLPSVPIVNVSVDGSSLAPGAGLEAPGDIQMVISMATNLSAVVVFEARTQSSMAIWNDMLSLMASSNQIKQFSCSWRLSSGATNAVGDEIFQEMGAQGQSFFKASGDGDAYVVNPIPWPNDNPYVTLVGGTQLTMSGSGGAYVSEKVWNKGLSSTSWGGNGANDYWGSGGGISPTYALPSYQTAVPQGANGASTLMRNLPDVAMIATQIDLYYNDGEYTSGGGTSFAAPLWAGFMALVNQRAASLGLPAVGFANPDLYAIGLSANYTNAFHDVKTGNNQWPGSPTSYAATAGYDLCAGWGSPNGTNLMAALINQLMLSAPAIVSQTLSGASLTLTSAQGPPGGGYTLLATTNISLPLPQWNTNSASTFAADGKATNVININKALPGRFFRVRVP